MGDTYIPGDELEQIAQLLPRIKQLLSWADEADQQAGAESIFGIGIPSDDTVFGDSALSASVGTFHARWSDGHYQLSKETQNLTDIANNILDRFQKTDRELADALDGKQPADQSSSPTDAPVTLAPPATRATPGGRPPTKEN
jgi:hypothetical protein